MIEINDGFFVNPAAVTVVKAISKKNCALFVTGQSALDGFVLNRPALDVAQEVLDALIGADDSDTPPEDDEETDNDEHPAAADAP